MGIEATREWLNLSLLAAQSAAGWLEQIQQFASVSARLWAETLAIAVQEVERAEDADDLMSVPVHIAHRQFDLSVGRLGESMRQWVQTEMAWTEQARDQALALAQRIAPGRDAAPAAGGALEAVWAEPLRQAQTAWLAMVPRGLDSPGLGFGR
jgi:hypothetical protein